MTAVAAALLLASLAEPAAAPPTGRWIQLFNGRDLTGWTAKIRGYPAGENFGNTFRVENGVLKVSYDAYGGTFQNRFGHLFYEREFSDYVLAAEYRFVGEQLPGAPAWGRRNSGLMIHGQSAASMGRDQDFPDSIEVQLLGSGPGESKPTANVCTPGTNVVLDGALAKEHCTNSRSKSFPDGEWVRVEVEVHGNGRIVHRVNGETVLAYSQPQKDDGTPLSRGTISLQSESHPVEFRKVELRELPAEPAAPAARPAAVIIDGERRPVQSADFGIEVDVDVWDQATRTWTYGKDKASVEYWLSVEVDEHSGEDGAPQPDVESIPVVRAAGGHHPSLAALGALTVQELNDGYDCDDWGAWFGNDAPALCENVVQFQGWDGGALRVRWDATYQDGGEEKAFAFEGPARFAGIHIRVRQADDADRLLRDVWGGQPVETLERHRVADPDDGPATPAQPRRRLAYVYMPKGVPPSGYWKTE